MPSLTLDEIFAESASIDARMSRELPEEPEPVSARYDRETQRVLVELNNGCVFGFPVWMIAGTSQATPEELKNPVILDDEAVGWEELNADIHVVGLMVDVLNVKALAAKWLGSVTSPAKAEAARENGKKGGRPRKQVPKQG
jgi:hypothetical protein